MFSTFLVPLDGSPLAEQALPAAERLAEAAPARLLLARVVVRAPATREAALSRSAQEYLERTAAKLANKEHPVDVAVLHGDTPTEIVSAVQAQRACLVVMSTHGRSGLDRWLHGSVADALIRLAPEPLVLVSSAIDRDWLSGRPIRILVPLDGSQHSEAILSPAADLATQLGAELLLLNVVAWPPVLYGDGLEAVTVDPEAELSEMRDYLDRLAATVGARGLAVRCRVDVGSTPATSIIRAAQEERVDLIAMSTHGRDGLARMLLGSTTTATIQHAGIPIVVVRPQELQVAGAPLAEAQPALARG